MASKGKLLLPGDIYNSIAADYIYVGVASDYRFSIKVQYSQEYSSLAISKLLYCTIYGERFNNTWTAYSVNVCLVMLLYSFMVHITICVFLWYNVCRKTLPSLYKCSLFFVLLTLFTSYFFKCDEMGLFYKRADKYMISIHFSHITSRD